MNQRPDERCKNGHLVSGENAYEVRPGHFRCRTCQAEAAKRYRRTASPKGSFKKAMSDIGLGLKWTEFAAQCEKSGWDKYDALNFLLSLPFVVLNLDPKALQNYLEIIKPGMEPGRNPLESVNDFMERYGRPEPKIDPPTDGEISF